MFCDALLVELVLLLDQYRCEDHFTILLEDICIPHLERQLYYDNSYRESLATHPDSHSGLHHQSNH